MAVSGRGTRFPPVSADDGDLVQEGSMAIFTTRAGAEEFVEDDPFVVHGVVRSWSLREWNEVLAG